MYYITFNDENKEILEKFQGNKKDETTDRKTRFLLSKYVRYAILLKNIANMTYFPLDLCIIWIYNMVTKEGFV